MKKIGLVCLALVLAMGALGVGYAHWSQTLYINGTVETGTFIVAWSELNVYEDDEYLEKDVGSCDGSMDVWKASKVDPLTGLTIDGYEKVVVSVSNAYPGYFVHIVLAVDNFGTIPAHVIEIVPTGRDETDGQDLTFEWLTGFEYEKGRFYDVIDGQLQEIINLEIKNYVCEQIDPCHSEKGEFDLHFKQPIEQGHTYSINIEMTAQQWNLD
jgi:hypothetical protein